MASMYLRTPPYEQAQFNILNSEFSSSLTASFTKVKEPSLSYYLPIVGERIVGCIPFSKDFGIMWNANSLIQELILGHRVHFQRR